MIAYIAMMALRLIELHRVLKPAGSLYLHCDPTASHYLKVLIDSVFGADHFRTEIAWKRSSAHSDTKQGRRQYGNIHDTLLLYAKGNNWTWNPIFTPYDQGYIDSFYKYVEAGTERRYRLDNLTGPGGAAKGNPAYEVMGVTRYWRYSKEKMKQLIEKGRVLQTQPGSVPAYKRYLDEMPGVPLQDIWTDLNPIASQAQERLGYPTQKPLALLERIISASSKEGDLVLDPFCGCGTTVHAAQKLNRRWIGIDFTHLAIHLIQRRLKDAFRGIQFDIVGVPKDLDGARALALQDKYEFQKWALAMIDAQPFKGGKKGGDGGVDGFLYIKPDGKKTEKVIVSVKGGQSLNPAMVKDLIVTVDQEGAKMGVFLTLEPPTKGMRTQAAAAGFYKTDYGQFPKIQIVTVEALFGPSNPLHLPWQDTSVFKKARREKTETQSKLDL